MFGYLIYLYIYWTIYLKVESNARRLGLTKNIDVGILGDAKLTSEALLEKLAGASPACLDNADAR